MHILPIIFIILLANIAGGVMAKGVLIGIILAIMGIWIYEKCCCWLSK